MKWIKKVRTYLLLILSIPFVYGIISIIGTYISVNTSASSLPTEHKMYLSTNGVHLEIILHKKDIHPTLIQGIKHNENENYFSFGWGDKNFYVKTPTWADLSITTSFKALFLNTSTLLHVTRYTSVQDHWVEIKISQDQLDKITEYIESTFQLDTNQQKIIMPGLGYYKNDDFYEAKGNYNCFRTCNTWINTGLKKSGIKACLWTPYDFRLLDIHQK